MKILMIIIILSVIYVISFRYMYLLVQRQYSKGGKYEGLEIGFLDFFFVFIPFANTFAMIYELLDDIEYSYFFNIKK